MEADKGSDKFVAFNGYIDKEFGKDTLLNLFENKDLSDEDKIKQIDDWIKSYNESQNESDTQTENGGG